jgi:hypothetical protein
MYRLYITEKTNPLMPPTALNRTVKGDPIAPINPTREPSLSISLGEMDRDLMRYLLRQQIEL